MPSKSQVKASVFVLISLFALSSWINASAMWVELPLMISVLPEKWSLPSYLAFIIQCSNVAPAIYSLISKIRSMKSRRSQNMALKRDISLSFMIIGVSLLASVLMVFFWDKSFFVSGQQRSIVLFCLSGIFSLASCTSSLVYLPYMARFSACYLSVFYFGQGLSGLVPGIMSLVQGLGNDPICINSTSYNVSCTTPECPYTHMFPAYPDPRFSVKTFFVIVACILVTSLISFYILNFTHFKSHQVLHEGFVASDTKCQQTAESIAYVNITNDKKIESEIIKVNSVDKSLGQALSGDKLKRNHLYFYLTSVAILNLMTNGLIPATQTYTCLPYGNMTYTLTIRLSSIIGSLSSLFTIVLPLPGIRTIGVIMSVGVIIAIFHFSIAVLSPQPPMMDSALGSMMIVITALIMTSSFSFARVWMARKFHTFGGRKMLLWCGAVTQFGSFIGATIAFVLINWFKIFKSVAPCPDYVH